MHSRRGILTSLAILCSGCITISSITRSDNRLGESVGWGGIHISVTKSMTTTELQYTRDSRSFEFTAPSNGIYALFYISVENTGINEAEAPVLNVGNYDELTSGETEFSAVGVNDIRVYGDGEPGHIPINDTLTMVPYDVILVDGKKLEPYPPQPSEVRSHLAPDETRQGWVPGTIPEDTTPRLKIQYKDKAAFWIAGG